MRLRRVLSFAVGTGISRALGLLREMVIAGVLGAGWVADGFYVALRIPMLLRDLVAENAVQSAFIPAYEEAKQKREAGSFLAAVVCILLSAMAVVVGLGVLLAPALVRLLAPGFSAEVSGLASTLTRITFPFLALVSFSALVSGLLNTKGKFFVPALSPAFFNLGIVVLGLLAMMRGGPRADLAPVLAVGVLVGGGAQLLFQIPFLGRVELAKPRLRHPSLRTLKKLMGPVVLSVGFSRISLFVNTVVASFLGAGAIAYLNYGFRVMQLPLGTLGVGVSTVATPELARLAARGESLGPAARRAALLSLALTLPAAVLLITQSQALISLLFERGAFQRTDSLMAAQALTLYAIGVPGASLAKVYLAGFFARKETRVPNFSFAMASGINVALAVSLGPLMGFPGLALATGLSSLGQALFLAERWTRAEGGVPGRELAAIGLASGVGVGIPGILASRLPLDPIRELAVAACLGALGYVGILVLVLGPKRALALVRGRHPQTA